MKKRIIAMGVAIALVSLATIGDELSIISYAAPNTKTMIVDITEGALDKSNLSKTVNIPNLKSANVKSVSSGGSATLNISGNNITVNASGGTPTRTVNNPKKLSKEVTDFTTKGTDSFNVTLPYNKDGYVANLVKDGVSRVISGALTPEEVREFNGPNHDNNYIGNYYMDLYKDFYMPKEDIPQTRNYNRNGFKGTLTLAWAEYDYCDGWISNEDGYPSCIGDGYAWGAAYIGTVTKPEVDTRVWRQDYKGTAYKEGSDNY